jgi:lysophospholipase L1-like esterase
MLAAQQPTLTPQQQLDQLPAKYNDFAGLHRYAAENASLTPTPGRVVFFGDSITDNWGRKAGSFFAGKPYVNRGISGQTTSQMVLRFQQDVVHLAPAAVVLLAGTNDIAENTGPISDAAIQDNIRSIVTLARANHIRVILGSIPPADRFPWRPGIAPAHRIRTMNAWLKSYAAAEHLVYLDYYTALATPEGAMKPDLATDKYVHPNDAGYAVMQPLAEAAIAKSLAQPAP